MSEVRYVAALFDKKSYVGGANESNDILQWWQLPEQNEQGVKGTFHLYHFILNDIKHLKVQHVNDSNQTTYASNYLSIMSS